jgi:hypothetical protein
MVACMLKIGPDTGDDVHNGGATDYGFWMAPATYTMHGGARQPGDESV